MMCIMCSFNFKRKLSLLLAQRSTVFKLIGAMNTKNSTSSSTLLEFLIGSLAHTLINKTVNCVVERKHRHVVETGKLDFCSTLCIFPGYSNLLKGYKCLNRFTIRLYVSRDVVFDETRFPFSKNPTHTRSAHTNNPSTIVLPPSLLTVPELATLETNTSTNVTAFSDNVSTDCPGDALSHEHRDDSATSATELAIKESDAPSVILPRRTRLQNRIVKPKEYTDRMVRYPLNRRAFTTAINEPISHV